LTTQIEIKKTAKQYEIELRRKEIALMIAKNQNITEIEIAEKLGVDNSTISKDIKEMKVIAQQFIYDITKSDFTFYYKQNLDLVRLVLAKQWELIEKENLTPQDVIRWKFLTEVLTTVETLNGYYDASKHMHRTPEEQLYYSEAKLGIRPGTENISPKSEKMETVQDELDGLQADLEFYKESVKEDLKNKNEIDTQESAELMVEIEENIETVKHETPQERKKRIMKDGYFTDWMNYSERELKKKASKYLTLDEKNKLV
jgi:HTH domain